MTALLNNRYRILKVLGAGGFGITSVAEDTHLPSQRRCVVKELKPSTDDPRILQIIRERFQKEAATLEMLAQASRQIPGLYAYFAENERFYLVQELVDGPTLTQLVAERGPLGEGNAKSILASLLTLLDYVHGQGIIHRDIKPDNILIRRQDNQPVLIDFGAVKETVTSTLDSAGRATASIVIGTPGFIPLEQAAGRPLFSSDLYSLGLTIIFLLTGKVPQEMTNRATGAISWMERAPSVSPQFAAILNKAIEPEANIRFRSAREMLEVLTQYAQTTAQELGGQNRQTVAAPPSQMHPPSGQQPRSGAGMPSSQTERWPQPPSIHSQPPSQPHSQPYSQPPSQPPSQPQMPPVSETQRWTPPGIQPQPHSQPQPQPPSQPPMRPASQGYQNYPSPQQQYSGGQPPMPPQYPPQYPQQHSANPGVGFAPAPAQKKGMSTAAKVLLVIGGFGFLGVVGIIALIVLAQLGSQQESPQVLPTPTPLAAVSSSPTPAYSYQTPTPPVEAALDVSGRWQFSMTMLNSETVNDEMNLQQDGEQVTSVDSDGATAKGTLRGDKLTLTFKQQLSAEDRAEMGNSLGDINWLSITISGRVTENRMSGDCSVKTNTGLSIGGICKWTATR